MKGPRHYSIRMLRCPVCKKGRILDEADRPNITHALLYKPEESENADWFLKCPNCKKQIGVSPDLNL